MDELVGHQQQSRHGTNEVPFRIWPGFGNDGARRASVFRLGSFVRKTLSATVTTAGAKGARAHRRGCPSRSPIRAMFKLTKLHKAVTEALNAVPNVDDLAKSLGAVDVRPRVVSEHGGRTPRRASRTSPCSDCSRWGWTPG